MNIIRNIFIVLGTIFIIFGFAAYFYSFNTDSGLGGLVQDTTIQRPYQNYGFPIIFAGIVLAIIGTFTPYEDHEIFFKK